MKLETGKLMLTDFMENAKSEKHPYILAHMSKEEGKVEVFTNEADVLFSLMVISELLSMFVGESLSVTELLTSKIHEN